MPVHAAMLYSLRVSGAEPERKGDVPGGGFLFGQATDVPLPELEPDAHALGRAAREFVRRRVLPLNAELERGDLSRLRALLAEAGSLGLLGLEIPAKFGGLEMPSAANAVASGLAHQAGFAVTCAAHLTIGTVPVVRHGTDEQRAALLPAIATGERVGAYALTEPGSGSDALALATRAERAAGGFRLSGQKCFITNAGIADHLIVFAQVEGAGPTAFLVDAHAPGVELGPEEPKLGLHGSSTRAVFLDRVEVPGARVVGDVGLGHRVALDALAVGRHKLGVLAAGHIELLLEVGARYAAERKQFGRPIGELGLVAGMLGESVATAYALEAVVARAAPLVSLDVRLLTPALVEAAACKITGSEAVCEIADAMLQVHGGLGYVRGSWVEQSYRDARANRIYEGTDEINRRTIAAALLRDARRGRLDTSAVDEARRALEDGPAAASASDLAEHARRLALTALGACERIPEARDDLEGPLADLALAAYAADSSVRRAARASSQRELHDAAATLAASRAVARAHAAYAALAPTLGDGVPIRGLSLLDVMPSLDRGQLRSALAAAALAAGRDPFARFEAIRPPPCGG